MGKAICILEREKHFSKIHKRSIHNLFISSSIVFKCLQWIYFVAFGYFLSIISASCRTSTHNFLVKPNFIPRCLKRRKNQRRSNLQNIKYQESNGSTWWPDGLWRSLKPLDCSDGRSASPWEHNVLLYLLCAVWVAALSNGWSPAQRSSTGCVCW